MILFKVNIYPHVILKLRTLYVVGTQGVESSIGVETIEDSSGDELFSQVAQQLDALDEAAATKETGTYYCYICVCLTN